MVLFYIKLMLQVSGLEGKEVSMQADVQVVGSLEKSIQEEERKIQELTMKSHAYIANPIPLNQFLGVVLRSTPSDVVIEDIFTKESIYDVGSGRIPTDMGEDGSDPGAEGESEEGEDVEPKVDMEEGTEGQENTAGQEYTGVSGTGNFNKPEVITIRGSAFSLQSISALATILRGELYIESVKVSPIENYDDGNFHHKIFEMDLMLDGGTR